MSHNKEAKSVTFRRGSEVSQENSTGASALIAYWALQYHTLILFAIHYLKGGIMNTSKPSVW